MYIISFKDVLFVISFYQYSFVYSILTGQGMLNVFLLHEGIGNRIRTDPSSFDVGPMCHIISHQEGTAVLDANPFVLKGKTGLARSSYPLQNYLSWNICIGLRALML